MTEPVPETPNDDEATPALDVIGEADDFAGDEVDVDEYGEETGPWPT